MEKSESEEKDDFELLPEGEENIRKIDFDSILFRQIDRIARYGTEGVIDNFGNGVLILDAVLNSMKDDNTAKLLKEIDESFSDAIAKLSEEEGTEQEREEKQRLALQYETKRQVERLKQLMGILNKLKKI